MRIGVLGLNYKVADIKLRELLARCCLFRLQKTVLPLGAEAFVILSTCNRTEVYFSGADLSACQSALLALLRHDLSEEQAQRFYSFFGRDCLHHLIRVTAGLDSAVAAETEIQGQVRACYEEACNGGALPKELHFLFQKALQAAKRLRSALPSQGLPTLEQAVASACLGAVERPNILLVGASQTNLSVAAHLQQKGVGDLTLCNRSVLSARTAALAGGLRLLPWESLPLWPSFDAVVCATKAPHYLLKETHWQGGRCHTLIDLSMPRNIDPALTAHCRLYHIDALQHSLQQRRHHLAAALDAAEGQAALLAGQLLSQWLRRESFHRQAAAV